VIDRMGQNQAPKRGIPPRGGAALSGGSRTQILNLGTAIDNANNGQGGCPLS